MLQVYVCVGSSCHLKGSYYIIKTFDELIRKYKLEDKVELKASFCLGSCTNGVAAMVGNEKLEGLEPGNAALMFERYVLKKVMT